jgi:YgiT-type zinc finger domain-containing protein
MKCPQCEGEMVSTRKDEDFEFDTGRGVIQCHAERVPVEECPGCGEILSGSVAAGRRAEATLRAVLDLLHRVLPK